MNEIDAQQLHQRVAQELNGRLKRQMQKEGRCQVIGLDLNEILDIVQSLKLDPELVWMGLDGWLYAE